MRMRKYAGGGLGGVFKRGKWKSKGKAGDVNNPQVSLFERSSGGDVRVAGAVQDQREGE